METVVGGETISIGEVVRLGAVDNNFFGRTFFPTAFRQSSPRFHKDVDELLDDPRARFANLRIFRGGAKTTKLRTFIAKRVAYATSHTILYVGSSEQKAAQTIRWLRTRIEPRLGKSGTMERSFFANTFDLQMGTKWTETELEIKHPLLDQLIWILGVGITSDSLRGINFEDYRPDLIILDDIVTDENAATKEQREKICDLVFGAIQHSLAPSTEEPNAKLAILQTPIHIEDVSSLAEKDSQFRTASFSCWTPETQDLPIELQQSSWPERYTSEELRRDKQAAIARNRLSVFSREMECTLVSPELCPFKPDWLQYYDGDAPRGGVTVLAIDPVPPASDAQLARNLANKDFEAHTVWRRVNGNYYLVDLEVNRGHMPNWSVTTALQLVRQHGVMRIVLQRYTIEKTLKWLLQQEMIRRQTFTMIVDTQEQHGASKHKRITGALQALGSHGKIYVGRHHTAFIQQWTQYRPGIGHDDILDASATAITDITSPYLEAGAVDPYRNDNGVEEFELVRSCP